MQMLKKQFDKYKDYQKQMSEEVTRLNDKSDQEKGELEDKISLLKESLCMNEVVIKSLQEQNEALK